MVISIIFSVNFSNDICKRRRAQSVCKNAKLDAPQVNSDLSVLLVQVNSSFYVSAIPGYDYEVCLSLRGSDTHKRFPDFLYDGLLDAGVQVFKDNEGAP